MDYKSIRLKEEQSIYNNVFETIQADEILELMKLSKMENLELANYRKSVKGVFLRVTSELMPDLYKLFQNVINRLGYKKPVECYVLNEPTTNAFSFSLNSFNQPNMIIITSHLINTFEDSEIEFTIAHEIGHLIIEEKELGLARYFIFNNSKNAIKEKYQSLSNEIRYLDNLIELSADRFGLIGCKELNASISALFKIYSGINTRKKFTFSQLFEDSDKELSNILTAMSEDMLKDRSASTSFLNDEHPIYPIRILSLKYFNDSKLLINFKKNKIIEDLDLEKNIDKLCEKLQDFENYNELLPHYIAATGILVAGLDNKITKEKIDEVENTLSSFVLFPIDIINYYYESKDKRKNFEDTTKALLEAEPDISEGMFSIIILFCLSNGIFHPKEKEFIFEVGENLFHFSKETIATFIANGLRDMYFVSSKE